MPRTIIDKDLYNIAKKELAKLPPNTRIANKLQAIISSYKYTIKETAKILDMDKSTIYQWAKILKQDSVKNLVNKPKHKDGLVIKAIHKKSINKWIKTNPNLTIKAVKQKIQEEYGIDVSKSTIHRTIQKLNYSHITPRPKHYKQDIKQKQEFKKNSKQSSKK